MERTPPIPWIEGDQPFPPTAQALGADSGLAGLLAIGADLRTARLEEAYRRGIFPWYSKGQPILWWAPDPRMVLKVSDFKLSRSLRKTLLKFLRTPGCEFRFDSAFEQVMRNCSEMYREGQVGTWITEDMLQAYSHWHQAGRVHSIETWVDGQLVGGLYGVNLGRMFYGESMFSLQPDASKLALAALVAFCRRQGIPWIDCQQNTAHLASLGAAEVPRLDFEGHLASFAGLAASIEWSYDGSIWSELGLRVPARAPGDV